MLLVGAQAGEKIPDRERHDQADYCGNGGQNQAAGKHTGIPANLGQVVKGELPSAFVMAYQTTMTSGTTVKTAIQSRYGPASQREDLDLSIAYTSERFMI